MASATLTDSRVTTLVEPKHHAAPPGARQWLERFDTIYKDSDGESSRIPWSHEGPCPSMVAWLNAEAPALVRCGARTAVVGCGLGKDAVTLCERGYDVVAFDACPGAIEWAQRLHPDHADIFIHADLFNLPQRLRNRFDLVIEVHTLQSLPPEFRQALAAGMAALLSPRGGMLLAVCRGRDPKVSLDGVDAPPFELTSAELTLLMEANDLQPMRPVDEFFDGNDPPVRRLRGVFRRA